jgi:hypothetical protein
MPWVKLITAADIALLIFDHLLDHLSVGLHGILRPPTLVHASALSLVSKLLDKETRQRLVSPHSIRTTPLFHLPACCRFVPTVFILKEKNTLKMGEWMN